MDCRKISRSLRASAEGVKIKVKSACSNPTPILMEEQNPSVYEIDILSSFDFHKSNKKETVDVPIKMTLTKAATRALEIKREESTNCTTLEIPLLESYHQTFQQPQSKVKDISFKKEKIDSKIQTDLIFENKRQNEQEKKASKEKTDPEKQSPSEDFKEFMKSTMTDNFILKDDSVMKNLFKNLYGKLNKDQLHLHHHEHHHHYYLDNSTLTNESASQVLFKKILTKSQKVKSNGGKKVRKGRKCQTGKEEIKEKEQETYTYYFKCPRESNLTFTKTSSGMFINSESSESSKGFKTSKIKEKMSSATFESSRLKFSNSDESILNKKSDFITTHIYSDTELKKCDSEMLHMEAIMELDKSCSKEGKKDENKDYKSILSDFNNFTNKSPIVIADQKTVPETSHIRCEGMSLESSSTEPNDQPFYDTDMSATKMENEEKIHSAESKSYEDESMEKEIEKNEEHFRGQYDSEIWTTMLKAELGEIKKELKRIEERHLHNGKSFTSIFNNSKSIVRSESSQNVTVYSSKTFIVGADRLYVADNGDQEQIEKEVKSASRVKLAFKRTGNERERWHYREKRSFFERTVLN